MVLQLCLMTVDTMVELIKDRVLTEGAVIHLLHLDVGHEVTHGVLGLSFVMVTLDTLQGQHQVFGEKPIEVLDCLGCDAWRPARIMVYIVDSNLLEGK